MTLSWREGLSDAPRAPVVVWLIRNLAPLPNGKLLKSVVVAVDPLVTALHSDGVVAYGR